MVVGEFCNGLRTSIYVQKVIGPPPDLGSGDAHGEFRQLIEEIAFPTLVSLDLLWRMWEVSLGSGTPGP